MGYGIWDGRLTPSMPHPAGATVLSKRAHHTIHLRKFKHGRNTPPFHIYVKRSGTPMGYGIWDMGEHAAKLSRGILHDRQAAGASS